MHITELVLDGFKSYSKRTVISGFDTEFNAITGLNGSGKSNILDSICFVLGISNLEQVRAKSLNELIYKSGQAGITKASVTLVFDNSNPDMRPLGYENYKQITITRQIAVGGRNKYMINGASAQLQRVQNLFHSVGLNVNNPHFLIMQGRIVKVLNMKPIEILGLIEEAAGTRMFETKKQNAVKTIEKKQGRLLEIDRVMSEEVTPRLDKLSGQRAQYLEYTKLSADVESSARIVQAYEFVQAQDAAKKCADGRQADDAARARLTAAVKDAETEEAALKQQLSETLKRKEKESAGELKKLESREQEASKKLVQLSAEHTQLRKAHEADGKATEKNEADVKKIEASRAKATEEVERAKAATATATEASKAAGAIAAEKQAALEGAMGLGATATGEQSSKNLQGQLSDASSDVSSRETELKAAEMSKKHLGKEIKVAEKAVADARKSGGKQEKEHAALASEVAELRKKLEAAGFDEAAEAALSASVEEKRRAAEALGRRERDLAAGVAGYDFKYADPERKFDRSRVKGTVASNLRVRETQHVTALDALAGGRLHHVIVDNSDTGMLLLSKGQLKRRVTLIPLDKITPNVLAKDKVAAAKKLVGEKKAHLALDLIEFAEEVTPAMASVFGGVLVCTDKDAASKVCEKLRLKCVTLEGDLYDPSGTLTGGSRRRGTDSLLHRLGELGEVRRQLGAAESEHGALAAKLDGMRKASEAHGALASSLELKQHQLGLHAEAMRSSPLGQLVASLEALQSQLADAEVASAAATASLKEAKERKEGLAKQLKAYEGNRDEMMKAAKAEIAAATKEAKAKEKATQAAAAAEQRAVLALEALAKELGAALELRHELEKRQAEGLADIEKKAAAELKQRDEYDACAAALRECQEALSSYDKETSAISARREALEKERGEASIELSKIEARCARYDKEAAAAEGVVAEMLRKHPWIEAEKHTFGVAGTEYDFSKRKPAAMQKELAKKEASLENLGKRINKNVLMMLEKAEEEYTDLKTKKEIVEADKEKLEAVITELAQKKIETLQKTWTKVNGDFGSIFSMLLPNAYAKLEPQEGCPVEEGLIVKVGFGEGGKVAWKQSLTELSGGQRSLIALSLVLSLLRFKPAPIYILDEVDAALDLSHTQNIGKMIKAHFKQSQFLIVSLKEGMFNNANVIFRTTFLQADGFSTVNRTVNATASSAAPATGAENAPAGKKKVGGANAKKALGENNNAAVVA